MPQRFLYALAFTVTLTTNLNPMTRDDDHHDGSKLTLPRFDPKDPTYFDDLQAYAQDRGLGWLLHANDDDTNDISKYEDMQSEKFQNLKTTGDDATEVMLGPTPTGVNAPPRGDPQRATSSHWGVAPSSGRRGCSHLLPCRHAKANVLPLLRPSSRSSISVG